MKHSLLLLPLVLLLAGCIPYPHIAVQSQEVNGRVIDAGTRKPVAHAQVVFIENPAFAGMTDEKGEFTIKETRKFQPFVDFAVHRQLESITGKSYGPKLRVTCAGYRPFELDAELAKHVDVKRYPPGATYGFDQWCHIEGRGPIFLKPISLRPAR